jgi:hypothetical protein
VRSLGKSGVTSIYGRRRGSCEFTLWNLSGGGFRWRCMRLVGVAGRMSLEIDTVPLAAAVTKLRSAHPGASVVLTANSLTIGWWYEELRAFQRAHGPLAIASDSVIESGWVTARLADAPRDHAESICLRARSKE